MSISPPHSFRMQISYSRTLINAYLWTVRWPENLVSLSCNFLTCTCTWECKVHSQCECCINIHTNWVQLVHFLSTKKNQEEKCLRHFLMCRDGPADTNWHKFSSSDWRCQVSNMIMLRITLGLPCLSHQRDTLIVVLSHFYLISHLTPSSLQNLYHDSLLQFSWKLTDWLPSTSTFRNWWQRLKVSGCKILVTLVVISPLVNNHAYGMSLLCWCICAVSKCLVKEIEGHVCSVFVTEVRNRIVSWKEQVIFHLCEKVSFCQITSFLTAYRHILQFIVMNDR